MWPNQRNDADPAVYETDLGYAIQGVLKLAKDLVQSDQLSQRVAVFALFLAGWASTFGGDKRLALELLRAFEHETIGCNTRATRTLLERCYARQGECFKNKGHSLDVDWIAVANELKYYDLVHFGL